RREELRLLETAAGLAGGAVDHPPAQEGVGGRGERKPAIFRALSGWGVIIGSGGGFFDLSLKKPQTLPLPPEGVFGKVMHEVLPPWLADAHQRAFERALATNEPERLEYSLDEHHERRFYEACIVRADGDRLLSIVRDITDRKRAELDAAAQRQELAHLNR